MLQRIQSIWLLLAAITLSCLLFVPMVTANVGGMEFQVLASGLYQKTGSNSIAVETSMPLLICTIAVSLMCLINIFNFRNRMVQKRVALVSIAFIIGLSFWCSQFAKKIPGGIAGADYNAGMFIPVIAIAFCVLAIKGINKDENLIKSADRLR